MTLLVRVLAGAGAGVLGSLATWAAGNALALLVDRTDAWDLELIIIPWFVLLVLLGGVIGTAALHGLLLALLKQPRPWSVVGPGAVLMIVMAAVGGVAWGLFGIFAMPVTACVLAGVVTEPISRWQVVRARQSGSAHGEAAPPTT